MLNDGSGHRQAAHDAATQSGLDSRHGPLLCFDLGGLAVRVQAEGHVAARDVHVPVRRRHERGLAARRLAEVLGQVDGDGGDVAGDGHLDVLHSVLPLFRPIRASFSAWH